ncbi:MAG TPA: O-methyltransferase [Bacteroidales bacterium]|nr:O-methyltransferase [Bacteroidales bacterium]
MITTELEDYILNVIDPEDPLLYELYRETNVKTMHPRMVTGRWQGQILQMISTMIAPRLILEIGTFTGYSGICLARGLAAGGHLHTIEINDELIEIPQRYFKRSGLQDKITIHVGDALEIIPTLNMEFDLVFIDGEKSEYIKYYDAIFDKVRPGGFIMADNILWSGKVLKEVEKGDYFTEGIINFNLYLKNDSRVEKTIIPLRDGTMLIRKK